MKGDQNGLMLDKKGNDGVSEKTGNGWPARKLDCSMSANDFANADEKEARNFVTSNSHSSNNLDSFRDSVFYMDKSVMECSLPELVVCYKEGTYHVVKDICIDEGVPTQDKFLFDSGVNEKNNSNFLPSENDQDSKPMKEKSESDISMQVGSMPPEESETDNDTDNECGSNKSLHADICTPDVSLSLEENEPNEGILSRCDSKDLKLTTEMKDDAMKISTNDVPKEVFTLGELLSMPELSTVNSNAMASDYKSNGIEQQCFENSREKEDTVTAPLVSADKELNNSGEKTILSAAASGSVAEELDSGKGEATRFSPAQASASEKSTSNGLVDEVCDDNKLVAQSIAFGSLSSAPIYCKDEGCHNLDREPPETGGAPKLEGTTDLPFSNNLQSGYGESSFSAAGPVTGLISYSGPIAYSGSLSVRSDSSTTSTRSFAFPILQSEWNSSPVRMAKADRTHYRKHKGWRQGLLCCRF
ncbi:18S pre-ribosomal assembly protein gar2-related, putative isoform 2 [Hibiscus syriacus]|uniref:18S pre-ribosomal assembly protein gar2-related, putative isoform 2 n=1 Tax=Hibiscus syriacus TaxID=106335 RepID=A0A6A3CLM0_HIBSY|nr:uncharacterized protein LOC120169434 [Hibiscus syriacus]KAE8730023.1 18S pre-ribosomal assembly protein gar2-related, putative isoform 2 [Hibiscus syriacus]